MAESKLYVRLEDSDLFKRWARVVSALLAAIENADQALIPDEVRQAYLDARAMICEDEYGRA